MPFGSYSLGVSTKDGDIDLVCVASSDVKRDIDFYEDLSNRISQINGVTNLSVIKGASVPIITFYF